MTATKVYVASSWANATSGVLDAAHRALRAKGLDSYDFRSLGRWWDGQPASDAVWGRTRSIDGATAFASDFASLDAARGLLAVLPAGESTAIEAAYASGAGKPVVVVGRPRTPLELMWLVVEAKGGILGLDYTIEQGVDALAAKLAVADPYADVMATAVGVDSGFAFTGLACVSRMRDGRLVSRGVRLVRTEKDHNSGVRAGMDDARRMRELWLAITEWLNAARPNVMGVESYETYRPEGLDSLIRACNRMAMLNVPSSPAAFASALSHEPYARKWIEAVGKIVSSLKSAEAAVGMGLGPAAKTIGVLWIAVSAGYERGTPSYIYTPSQMVKAITGMQSGGTKDRKQRKANTMGAVTSIVEGLTESLYTVPASYRDHCADATGHAVMALLEYEKWRASYGVNG